MVTNGLEKTFKRHLGETDERVLKRMILHELNCRGYEACAGGT